MIVTIDGPSGSGKSSVARSLADRLGYRFLDTGAMYRAVIWSAKQNGVELTNGTQLAELAETITIEQNGKSTLVDGRDVSNEIRTGEITRLIFHAADNVKVRHHLTSKQREIASGGNVVSEGRDQGTIVFPDAECKIFLTASAEERARRRQQDMKQRGEEVDFDEVLRRQNERDHRDRNREVGRLLKANDAIELCTDGMTPDQVLDELERIVRSCMARPTTD